MRFERPISVEKFESGQPLSSDSKMACNFAAAIQKCREQNKNDQKDEWRDDKINGGKEKTGGTPGVLSKKYKMPRRLLLFGQTGPAASF